MPSPVAFCPAVHFLGGILSGSLFFRVAFCPVAFCPAFVTSDPCRDCSLVTRDVAAAAATAAAADNAQREDTRAPVWCCYGNDELLATLDWTAACSSHCVEPIATAAAAPLHWVAYRKSNVHVYLFIYLMHMRVLYFDRAIGQLRKRLASRSLQRRWSILR